MTEISITPSIVLEYLFCPRFIYYMICLKIPQQEDKRYKVEKGRRVHDQKSSQNTEYLRKQLGVIDKKINQKLISKKYSIHGEVDEVLFLDNGTAAPLDYKFARYKKRIFKTYKYQAVMYAMMIEDNFNCNVNKAFIVYTRSKNKLIKIDITAGDKKEVKNILNEVIKIIKNNYYPKKTNYNKRCQDCCYRNICIR